MQTLILNTQFNENLESKGGFLQILKCCARMLVNLFETWFTGVHICISNYSTCTIQLWCTVYIKGPTCKPSLTYMWITPLPWLHANFNLQFIV